MCSQPVLTRLYPRPQSPHLGLPGGVAAQRVQSAVRDHRGQRQHPRVHHDQDIPQPPHPPHPPRHLLAPRLSGRLLQHLLRLPHAGDKGEITVRSEADFQEKLNSSHYKWGWVFRACSSTCSVTYFSTFPRPRIFLFFFIGTSWPLLLFSKESDV